MVIENIMYFVLGLLVAGLLALMVVPAIWRRAVRLTKQRIEAATPISLAEFRADKDQLRAEFALTTRKLEMTIETLRARLAERLGDFDQQKVELSSLRLEREHHRSILAEHEARVEDARQRVLELEKANADLAQRLRMRERELEDRNAELADMREAATSAPALPQGNAEALSGEFREDVDALMASLSLERRRVHLLESRTQSLLDWIGKGGTQGLDMATLARELRSSLAASQNAADDSGITLAAAEERISSAESRLTALLDHDAKVTDGAAGGTMLAEQLSSDETLDQLRRKVGAVENAIMSAKDPGNLDIGKLRGQLNAIAVDVSRVIYSTEKAGEVEKEESLFDRVRRFSSEDLEQDELPHFDVPPKPERRAGPIAQRMAALQQIRNRR